MTKLLDLRNKGINKVKVVEHIIFKPRSFKVEMIKMFSVIAIVSVIGFGISNADNLNPFLENGIETATENFSSLGIISEITEKNLTLVEARGSDKSGDTTYNLDITHLEKVETNSYEPLIVTDLKAGDKIIAQGLTNGNKFFIKRIVSFGGGIDLAITTEATTDETATTTTDGASAGSPDTNTATTTDETATTTDDVVTETSTTTIEVSTSTTDIATTTDEVSTSTEDSTTTESSTTTPGIIEQVGDIVEEIIETVTETVQNVIDTVTGTSTPYSVPNPPTTPHVEEPVPVVPEPVVNPEPESISETESETETNTETENSVNPESQI